jgi:2-phosphosulfolactate phosphatase
LKVRVGFTPIEPVAAPVGIVVDVLRATSTICQALASGVERVTCAGEVDEARALARGEAGTALAGERGNVKIAGFDFGNSPREFERPGPGVSRLVLTTTNGTRLLLAAAARCDTVLVGSLLNLEAVVAEAAGAAEVAVLCAGVEGAFAIDDAYVAGRISAALGGEPDDAAIAAIRLAAAFGSALEGIGGGVSADNLRAAGLAEDVPFCARVGLLDLVPRVVERGSSAVVVA